MLCMVVALVHGDRVDAQTLGAEALLRSVEWGIHGRMHDDVELMQDVWYGAFVGS